MQDISGDEPAIQSLGKVSQAGEILAADGRSGLDLDRDDTSVGCFEQSVDFDLVLDAVVVAISVDTWTPRSTPKLTGPPDLLDVLERCGLSELPIRSRHTAEAGSLPLLHRDPFDRMLVAQARCDGLTLLSRDPQVQRHDLSMRAV
ncbi:MAG TPA: type II toxin-antitoxin system VapC family toxin [Kineosporiaceae bacterium]